MSWRDPDRRPPLSLQNIPGLREIPIPPEYPTGIYFLSTTIPLSPVLSRPTRQGRQDRETLFDHGEAV
jgi:hypothetical protein